MGVGLLRPPHPIICTNNYAFPNSTPPFLLVPYLLYIHLMSALLLDIDSNIPLPPSMAEALPPMTLKEELEVRANTIKLLSDLTGKPIVPKEENMAQAREAAKDAVDNKPIDLTRYPNETIAYLAGMVSQYDVMVVNELAELKLFVVNKLIEDTGNKDAKVRIQALRALGEIDGVDAFKRRTEITVQHRSTEEIERALLEKLDKFTIDVDDDDVVEVEEVQTSLQTEYAYTTESTRA